MVNNEENGHGIYASGHLTTVSTEAIADVVTRTPYVTDPIATDTERRITIYGKKDLSGKKGKSGTTASTWKTKAEIWCRRNTPERKASPKRKALLRKAMEGL